jgi:hypothetical protein
MRVSKLELYKLLDNWKKVSGAWTYENVGTAEDVDAARQACEDAIDTLYESTSTLKELVKVLEVAAIAVVAVVAYTLS